MRVCDNCETKKPRRLVKVKDVLYGKVNLLSKLTSAKIATSHCSEGSKRNDSVFDGTYIEVHCDNCGAKYIVFDTDPNLPELHRVCDTCFMPMCARNDYYYWRLEWIKSSRQFS